MKGRVVELITRCKVAWLVRLGPSVEDMKPLRSEKRIWIFSHTSACAHRNQLVFQNLKSQIDNLLLSAPSTHGGAEGRNWISYCK